MNTYSIGIDIGGTNTDIGLVRDDGRCLAKKNLPTNKYYDASIYVSDIYEQIKFLMAENGVKAIDGIGIAAPAGNYYTGCIENATNLNFKGIVDLAAALASLETTTGTSICELNSEPRLTMPLKLRLVAFSMQPV